MLSPGGRLTDVGSGPLGDGQGPACGPEHTVPVLLVVGQVRQVQPGLPEMGCLANRPENPPFRLSRHLQGKIILRQQAHGGTPFIRPSGCRQSQMPLEHGNALLPPPVEKILPPQVMHVAVVVGVFLHRQLQQGQVLSPALASVRMVLQTDPLHVPCLGRSPVKLEHLMDRIHPAAALSPVDLVIPKHHPLPSVWEEVPNIAVEQTIHTRGPGRLYLFPPARLEHLVQIGAHAEVRILWNQLQRLVPGHIKAPGTDGLHRHLGTQRPEPLNGIVGLSRILLDTELTAEQEKYLKTIHVSAVTLGNIFNDIIDMDKMERRKVQLDNQPVDFTSFLADLENLSALQAQQKGLRFNLEPTLPLPHQVITDGTRLRQILWNLISNAVKFTQQGQVTVRVRYDEGDMLHFEVEDSGIGIPQDELDKIFAMYYQVKDSHGGKPATGTGIGLAVSRRLAKNMGGDITVTSEQGKGSTFTLTIHAPSVAEEVDDAFDEDDMPLPALNVLLVEDIELNVIVARSVLEKLGNSVDVAMTGKAALEMFKPGEYDLVLLDIQLPDMTGLDISRELTKRYPREDLPPLVALTANVLKDKQEYLNAGMDDVLSKPLSVPALTAMIKKFWDTQDDEESTVTTEENSKSEALLDIPMLEQYLELVGPKLITDGLAVFEKMMPGYVSVLESNLTAQDKKGIVEEGHKIKGAAGSVGLRHLQQLGQQIQSPDLPAWEDNVGEWIEEMKEEWRHDVEVLKAWVAKATKK